MDFIATSLDVTPDFSFNTLQFESEALNVIVSSLLVSVIIHNTASIISKIIQISPRESFSFSACRRFVVFLNSDDPLRLFKWWFGDYSFHEKHWKRNKQKAKFKFLVVPLLARLFLFVASIASIAISIPTENVLSGCENGDFRPILNVSQARISREPLPPCVEIPMVSRLGIVTSRFKYCTSKSREVSAGSSQTFIVTSTDINSLGWSLTIGDTRENSRITLDWTRVDGFPLVSVIPDLITPEQVINTLLQGLVMMGVNCDVEVSQDVSGVSLSACDLVLSETVNNLNSFLLSSIVMEKVPEPQRRTPSDLGDDVTLECPIDVVVNRPLVNLVPLSIFLVLIVIINVAVSAFISRYGNIVDSSHHVVKEVFDRDCTSNPLEEPCDITEQVDSLPLCRVIRDRKGHVGFLVQHSDQVVDDFDKDTLVCSSVRQSY